MTYPDTHNTSVGRFDREVVSDQTGFQYFIKYK